MFRTAIAGACAALALSTAAFAQTQEPAKAPVCKAATDSPACGEVFRLTAELARASLAMQALQAQRNAALSQAADMAAMAEVEKAQAQAAKPAP